MRNGTKEDKSEPSAPISQHFHLGYFCATSAKKNSKSQNKLIMQYYQVMTHELVVCCIVLPTFA